MPQVDERRTGPDGAVVTRRARRLAWALLSVTAALLAAGPVIGLTGGESWSAILGFIPVALTFAVVGALVAARTGNRLGWLFLAAAAISAVTVAAKAYAARPGDGRTARGGMGRMGLHRAAGDHRVAVLPDPAAVPGRPAAVAAVADRGVGGGRRRGGRDGDVGRLRRQLLVELPPADRPGDARRAA